MFLSSCRELWPLSKEKLSGGECDEVDEDRGKPSGEQNETDATKKTKTSSNDPTDAAAASDQRNKKKRKKEPFFISGANYLSLLNIAEMKKYFGPSLREYWEGLHESFIQNIKRELDNMRHTEEFLGTVLRKVLCTMVLGWLNGSTRITHTTRRQIMREQTSSKITRPIRHPVFWPRITQ